MWPGENEAQERGMGCGASGDGRHEGGARRAMAAMDVVHCSQVGRCRAAKMFVFVQTCLNPTRNSACGWAKSLRGATV